MTNAELESIRRYAEHAMPLPVPLLRALLAAYDERPSSVAYLNLQTSRDLAVTQCTEWRETLRSLDTISDDLVPVTRAGTAFSDEERRTVNSLIKIICAVFHSRFNHLTKGKG